MNCVIRPYHLIALALCMTLLSTTVYWSFFEHCTSPHSQSTNGGPLAKNVINNDVLNSLLSEKARNGLISVKQTVDESETQPMATKSLSSEESKKLSDSLTAPLQEQITFPDLSIAPLQEQITFPDLSIAVLTWKSPRSLRNSLISWRDSGLLESVNETVIFFNELQAYDLDVVNEFREYRLRFAGNLGNMGTGKGFDQAVMLTRTPFVLFLEKDWYIVPGTYNKSLSIIESGFHIVKAGNATLVRLRDTVATPVMPYCFQHEVRNMTALPDWFCNCATGVAALKLYGTDNVLEVFPGKPLWECSAPDSPERVICMRSQNCRWTNNPTIFSRQFFNDTLHSILVNDPGPTVDRHWVENTVSLKWAGSPFVVAVPYSGVFAHVDLEKM